MPSRHVVKMSLVGDKELIRKLSGLGDRVYKKVVAQASRKAFRPVVKTAKQLAPKETGLLQKSIGTKQKRYPRAGRIVTIVGPRTGFAEEVTVKTPTGSRTQKRNPVHYAHLVEFRTVAHTIGSGDSAYEHPGAAPQPFMRPAFDGNESQAKSIMHTELAAGVIREARKTA